MKALRLLTMPFLSLRFLRSRYHLSIIPFVSWLYPSPGAHNHCAWPGIIYIPHRNHLRPSFQVEPVSSPRFLGNPYIHLPCSWTPAVPTCQALRRVGAAPAIATTKASASILLSRLDHTASVLAVYASRFGHPNVQDSLPAGCQPLPDRTFTCWVTREKFLCCRYMSSPPRLYLAPSNYKIQSTDR